MPAPIFPDMLDSDVTKTLLVEVYVSHIFIEACAEFFQHYVKSL
jgi:hypothetical protein